MQIQLNEKQQNRKVINNSYIQLTGYEAARDSHVRNTCHASKSLSDSYVYQQTRMFTFTDE